MSEALYLSPCCKLPTDWVDRATENGRKELEGTLPEGIQLTDEDLKDIRECQGCGQRHIFEPRCNFGAAQTNQMNHMSAQLTGCIIFDTVRHE